MDERIIQYFQCEPGKPEKLKLLKEIESDDNLKRQFAEYKNMQALIRMSVQPDRPDESRRGYVRLQRLIRQKRGYRFVLNTLKYAAAIALLVMGTHWITLKRHTPVLVAETENIVQTPEGQRACLTLNDGTRVWLNARTTLSYPALFSGNERRVSVEGEAYFEVAEDTERPFIVSSQGLEMKVLGTTFNVYSYPGEGYVQTSLIEGKLQVYYPEYESEGVILKANEQVFIKESRMDVSEITHPDRFLWRNGILSFENELLVDIFEKLELYYDVKITVKDPSVFQWEYTGKVRQQDGIDEILRIFRKYHRFTIEKDVENNTIIVSK